MTYSIDDLTAAIIGYGRNSDAWTNFRFTLLNEEAARVPGIGWAYLVDQSDNSYEGGPVWFVFRMEPLGSNGHRLFRVNGTSSSYDGMTFNRTPIEVEAQPTQRVEWKAI